MKKITQFILGAVCLFGVWKFGALTFILLADGQFFTTILAAVLTFPLVILAYLFLGEAID